MNEILQSAFGNLLQNLSDAWTAFSYVWYIVLPVSLFVLFEYFWMYHIQTQYWLSQSWVLLEIIPSKELEKSPKLMESIFAGLAGVESTASLFDTHIDGKFPDSFSLEIVGEGGNAHFYIRTQKKYRNLVEAHFFAQYPDIEIVEVADYVDDVPKMVPNANWDIWGTDFELTKADPIPIRTYRKFEEDVTGKMIDPLANLVEVIGKLAPEQRIWLQYVISPESPTWAKNNAKPTIEKLKGNEVKESGVLETVVNDFKDVAHAIIPGITKPVEFASKDKKDQQPLEFRLSPGEKDILKATEENIGKMMYSVKMRYVYIGPRQGFDKSFVSSFIGGIKQFNDENLNGFKPDAESKTAATYFFIKPRLRYKQRKIFRRYRNRSRDGKTFVLSIEELATIFHMPDMQVMAPSISRVEAKRGGAPSNLPFE